MQKKIGLIAIGQSPREDIISEMKKILGSGIKIIERGALDDLTREEIFGLKPVSREYPLITRLKDSTTVIVSKQKIIPLVQKQITILEKQNVELISLLCTENFRGLKSSKLLLLPAKILISTVSAMTPRGKILILVPLSAQKRQAHKKWRKTGLKIQCEVLSPAYTVDEFIKVRERMKKLNVDLIVADCFGYDKKLQARLRQITNTPVIIPRILMAQTIKKSLTTK